MSHDTLIHRLVRPGVRVLAPLGVTPDQLTGLRLLTGLGAGALMAAGGGGARAAGAGVFLLSALFDRADGELARQTGRFSARGRRLDLLADQVSTVVVFLGLGWGLQKALGWMAPAMGAMAGVAVTFMFRLTSGGGGSPPPVFASPHRSVVVDPDDAMLMFPVLIWAGLAAPTLVLAATLTPLAAAAIGIARALGRGGAQAARPAR